MMVQRYCAPSSEREARKTILLAGFTSVFVWLYFTLVGTALWVFYRHVPDPRVANLADLEIFPHFIVTQVPVGLAGLVLVALIMAAMSTTDSIINACASIVVSDFYKRLFVKRRDSRHYVYVGRMFSIAFGAVMILTAFWIYYSRTTTLQELQNIFSAIFGSGLLGIALLGFLTRRAHNVAVLVSTALMILGVIIWLILDHSIYAGHLPHELWLAVFTNIFVFAVGYVLSSILKNEEQKDLDGLTLRG
jgi:SSS family solute:Na+ symporter